MRPVSDVFLIENPITASFGSNDGGEPESTKTTPTIPRVSLQELELTYLHNPSIFNGVNKIVQTIMSAPHSIEAENPKVKKFFVNFTKNLGNSGSEITWEEMLSTIFKHQCIYGRTWVENVFNKRYNRIVDWDLIDAKKMDYAKDANEKIVLDKYDTSVGYFESIPYMEPELKNAEDKKQLPERVIRPQGAKTIFFKPEQLAQIKLYTVGDGFYPIGLIEPIYKTSIRKMNVEEALANAIYMHGFPIIWAQLGDLNHEPTPEQIQTILAKLKETSYKREIATPYYYNLKMLEGKFPTKLIDPLDYFSKQEISGLGLPQSVVTGSTAIKNQAAMFYLTLRDIVRCTTSAIEKYMFARVCKYEGFKEVPTIKWDMIGAQELDQKAKRIVKYVQAGVLIPDKKIQEFIKKVENLD